MVILASKNEKQFSPLMSNHNATHSINITLIKNPISVRFLFCSSFIVFLLYTPSSVLVYKCVLENKLLIYI